MKILEKVENIVFIIYGLVFKEEATDTTKIFVKNFNYIAIGFGFSAIFGFLSQIFMGRFLGPDSYGKYALVQSISMFLFIPMSLGISTALIKYNAENSDAERQKKIISVSFLINLFLSIFLFLILVFIYKNISKIFGVPPYILLMSVLFAIFYNFYIFATDTLRSLHKMKELSIFQAFDGFIMLALILFFIFEKKLSFESSVYIACVTYFILFLSIIIFVRKYIAFNFDRDWFKKIVKYGFYATIGLTTYTFLLNFNKVLVAKYLGSAGVGIYNAYFFSSTGILSVFLGMFITVFFPMASKHKNKEVIFKKIDRAVKFLFLIGVPVFFIIEFIILKLYGNKYPIDLYLMIEFVVSGILIVSYNFYDYLFASYGGLGIKFVALVGVVMALINVALCFYLIPAIGLHGAIISLGFSYLLGIFMYLFLRKKMFN